MDWFIINEKNNFAQCAMHMANSHVRMNSRQCHNPIQEIADQSANVGYGVNPKMARINMPWPQEKMLSVMMSTLKVPGQDPLVREGETADGKSDEVGNCHGHGEQEQGVGLVPGRRIRPLTKRGTEEPFTFYH